MKEKTMTEELVRIISAVLIAYHEANRLAKQHGLESKLSAYRSGLRDALGSVLDELCQTFGFKVEVTQ